MYQDKPIQWKTRLVRSSVPSLHSTFASIGSLKLLMFLLAKVFFVTIITDK